MYIAKKLYYSLSSSNIRIFILTVGFSCVAFLGAGYWIYRRSQESKFQPISLTKSEHTPNKAPSVVHVQATMEVIHDDVVTYQLPHQAKRTSHTKAHELFEELIKTSPNFNKALENPQARANINRLLMHPEIEKKLNGWFASLIRSAIHNKVNEPDFPELIATETYVDELFKQYGIV